MRKRKLKLDIALPVFYGNLNEIEKSIKTQTNYFSKTLKNFNWKLILAINGQKAEKVIALAKKLKKKNKKFNYTYTPIKGKGAGVIDAWKKSNADIKAYMDIDLATKLSCFKKLIDTIVKEKYDVAIGSRYHPKSKTKRTLLRLVFSKIYNLIFSKILLGVSYKDSQCGFKAITKKVAKEVLPLVKNTNWFFEAEMLYIAHKKGFKIKEVPVVWKESDISSTNVYKCSTEFAKSSIKLRFRKIK